MRYLILITLILTSCTPPLPAECEVPLGITQKLKIPRGELTKRMEMALAVGWLKQYRQFLQQEKNRYVTNDDVQFANWRQHDLDELDDFERCLTNESYTLTQLKPEYTISSYMDVLASNAEYGCHSAPKHPKGCEHATLDGCSLVEPNSKLCTYTGTHRGEKWFYNLRQDNCGDWVEIERWSEPVK